MYHMLHCLTARGSSAGSLGLRLHTYYLPRRLTAYGSPTGWLASRIHVCITHAPLPHGTWLISWLAGLTLHAYHMLHCVTACGSPAGCLGFSYRAPNGWTQRYVALIGASLRDGGRKDGRAHYWSAERTPNPMLLCHAHGALRPYGPSWWSTQTKSLPGATFTHHLSLRAGCYALRFPLSLLTCIWF